MSRCNFLHSDRRSNSESSTRTTAGAASRLNNDLAVLSKTAELGFDLVDLIQRIRGTFDAFLITHRQCHFKAAGHGRD